MGRHVKVCKPECQVVDMVEALCHAKAAEEFSPSERLDFGPGLQSQATDVGKPNVIMDTRLWESLRRMGGLSRPELLLENTKSLS